MKQWNISIRWDFCRFLKMRFRGFHWKSALLRNIGGAAIPKAIPGNGVRSLPEAVKSPMENFLIRKRVLFQSSGFRILQTLGGTDMILMRFGMMKRRPSGKRKSWISIYLEENAEAEYFSSELKKKAGFGKGGEKGFDGVITALQMQTYLCVRDFRQRKNKKGEAYGWPVAVYCTPEHLWGRDHVTSAYAESAASSGEKIAAHMREIYPIATRQQVHRLVGNIVAL